MTSTRHTKDGITYRLWLFDYDDYKVVARPTERDAFRNIELAERGYDVWDDSHSNDTGEVVTPSMYEFDSTDYLIHLLQTKASCFTPRQLLKYLPDTLDTIIDNVNRLESKKIRRRIMNLPIVPAIPEPERERFRAILKRELLVDVNIA